MKLIANEREDIDEREREKEKEKGNSVKHARQCP